jgi:hypothetical protein
MITKADAKRRIVLPEAEPGDVYDVEKQREDQYLLVKLPRPEPRRRMSREDCLRAMAAAPLTPVMSWAELATLTREP